MEEQVANVTNVDQEVTVGEWLVSMLLMIIPFVNIVLVFVWAFGGGSKASKANFFKAQLILMAIGVVFTILFWGSLFASLS